METNAPLALTGPARVRLWSAVKSFQKKNAVVQWRCTSETLPATTAPSSRSANHNVNKNDYPGTPGSWLAKDLDLGTVSRTIPANRTLQLRLAVLSGSEDDMLFAYDTTAYPSALLVGP
jgi:hypothetical protein